MKFSLRTLIGIVLIASLLILVFIQQQNITRLNAKIEKLTALTDADSLVIANMKGNIEYHLSDSMSHQFYVSFPDRKMGVGLTPDNTSDPLMAMPVGGNSKIVFKNNKGALCEQVHDLRTSHIGELTFSQIMWDNLELEIICREFSGSLEKPVELLRLKNKSTGTYSSMWLYQQK